MRKLIFIASLLLASLVGHAESKPVAMPGDNRLVTFTYDANNTYTVLTIPDAVTDIQLLPDEKITALAVGDSVQWIVAKADTHVFVKPVRPNIFTSATLVTDKRTYQMTFRASPIGGKWFQRVSWVYPDIILYQQQLAEAKVKIEEEIKVAKDSALKATVVSNDEPGSPVDNINFDYKIEGDASFKPTQVFNNATTTWIRLNPYSQDFPALFLKENSKYELVNYIRDNDFMKVQRVFSSAVLKLGEKEVKITNNTSKDAKKGNFFSNIFSGQN